MTIESEMENQEQIPAERDIADMLRTIIEETAEKTQGITVWVGHKWREGFELCFLAKAVAEHNVSVPNDRMPRKTKKKAWGTISYRKKHHPDFGCPLSRKNLKKIQEC